VVRSGWWGALLLGAALVLLQASLPVGLARDAVFLGLGLLAVGGIVLGVRVHRPARALPWHLLAAGVGAWVLGDLLWMVLDHGLGVDPFPSVADVAYLAAYPVLALALWHLVPPGVRGGASRAVLDTLIVGLCVGLVLWVVFIEPTWTAPVGTVTERAVAIAYPVGDALLLAYLVHLGFSPLAVSPALRLLTGGLVSMLAADIAFQALASVTVYEGRAHVVDPLFTTAYVLLAVAALHPSMRCVAVTRRGVDRLEGGGRVAFLCSAAALLPVTLLVEAALDLPAHTTVVSLVSLPLIGLVALRMVAMIRRMRQQTVHLAHLADTDFLTGLLNRRRFVEHLAAAAADVRAGSDRRPAVLVVGLDRFTEINDTLGHRIGDELLRAVAARLRARTSDVVLARLGGDVFGVLVPDATGCAVTRAREVAAVLHEPFVVSDLGVDVDGSVGLVLLPDDGVDPAELLHRADVATSAARERPDRVARYHPQMEAGGALAPELMAELGHALDTHQVVVHYQPQVDVRTGRVVGAEALVRWQHPDHGLLGPGAFVPAAERTGQIRPLTRYVLDRALAECAAWRAAGRPMTVSVNLSVRNLLDPRLVEDVLEALDRHGVAAHDLELEITETSTMVDPHRSGEALRALDALGVALSIDDYGTGYGSLAYLQELPVRRLKIDRSFVGALLEDEASCAIVRSVVDLSRRLGLDVVAEGVEDDRTLAVLRDMRCDLAQGFGIARPSPGPDLAALVARVEQRLRGVLAPDPVARTSL
jgi:diguanylate cyclase